MALTQPGLTLRTQMQPAFKETGTGARVPQPSGGWTAAQTSPRSAPFQLSVEQDMVCSAGPWGMAPPGLRCPSVCIRRNNLLSTIRHQHEKGAGRPGVTGVRP